MHTKRQVTLPRRSQVDGMSAGNCPLGQLNQQRRETGVSALLRFAVMYPAQCGGKQRGGNGHNAHAG